MFEVKSRSVESWGPLAELDEAVFDSLITHHGAKDKIKEAVKRQKKLKTYLVTFKKTWMSDAYELKAENEYDVSKVAEKYFRENQSNIGFKEQSQVDKTRNFNIANGYRGYDTISYVKKSIW